MGTEVNNVAGQNASGTITSYKLKPSLGETFKGVLIKEIIHDVLSEKLQGKAYNVEEVSQWTKDITDTINTTIRNKLVMPRYKYIVQVMLGQQLGAGCHYYAKCCWDAESDSQISDVFSNTSLFCVCTVFGVYLY
ncbi:dynein light chain Tctex-type protein 2B [Musca domestica]|uniref:Dynein light chain Tctex-type protein 2B n=1 Tax=Musca domestica TaxID=7370 RepID=A0A9J7DA48_MUSDO|nr:dynein light chain Tctex-type protein 2B [Musca domestica]